MRRLAIAAAVTALMLGLGACGDDDDDDGGTATDETTAPAVDEAEAGTLAITAKEYSFEAPSTVEAGLVDIEFKNDRETLTCRIE